MTKYDLMVEPADDLDGFEEAWNGNARKVLPGWTGSFIGRNEMGMFLWPRICYFNLVSYCWPYERSFGLSWN